MNNFNSDEFKRKFKSRAKSVALVGLCIGLFPVPLYFGITKDGTTIRREYKEWWFCIKLLFIETKFGEVFTPTTREKLYREEFGE